jgi:hypothetical protein
VSLQTIIPGTAPTAQSLDANVLDGIVLDPNVLDSPDSDDIVEAVPETFCLACRAPVAAFESLGGELAHYADDPMTDYIMPQKSDHAPLLP